MVATQYKAAPDILQGYSMTPVDPFLHKKLLKVIFYNCVGIKTNIIQAGFITIYSLLLYSFFPSGFKISKNENIFVGP